MLRLRPAPVSRAKLASRSAKTGFERPRQRYQTASPLGRRHAGGDVAPLGAVMAEGDRPLAKGRPDPAADRLQAEPVLVFRPDLDRPVGGRCLGLGDSSLEMV